MVAQSCIFRFERAHNGPRGDSECLCFPLFNSLVHACVHATPLCRGTPSFARSPSSSVQLPLQPWQTRLVSALRSAESRLCPSSRAHVNIHSSVVASFRATILRTLQLHSATPHGFLWPNSIVFARFSPSRYRREKYAQPWQNMERSAYTRNRLQIGFIFGNFNFQRYQSKDLSK